MVKFSVFLAYQLCPLPVPVMALEDAYLRQPSRKTGSELKFRKFFKSRDKGFLDYILRFRVLVTQQINAVPVKPFPVGDEKMGLGLFVTLEDLLNQFPIVQERPSLISVLT